MRDPGKDDLERLIAKIATREQRRIGVELHDGICQELTGISLMCKALEGKLLAEKPELRLKAADISRQVNRTMDHVRVLISGLYPIGLERGLDEALRELVDKLGRTFSASFAFTGEDPRCDQDVSAHLYRIAQEAANNAARHGHPTRIDIRLEKSGDRLELTVRDDGRGFAPEAPGGEGRGLDIMRYRARLIGAALEIRSGAGEGCQVTCTLPRPGGRK